MIIRRGDIVIVKETETSESGMRPAIVVSNDEINERSSVVDVVYLTTQPQLPLKTHVAITSSLKPSTAKCEYVFAVNKDYLGGTSSRLTDSEMQAVDKALTGVFGLGADNSELVKVTKQRNVYKKLYENLVASLTE